MVRRIWGKTPSGPSRSTPKLSDKTQGKPAPSDELFSSIEQIVDDCQAGTSEWSSNQDKWHRLRMRIKKEKTFPFKNSSNLRMPTAELYIRKVKSAIMNVIFGLRPIVQAIPQPNGNWETATKIEKFLDHLLMDVIKIKPTFEIAVDQSLEKGFYLLKPYFRREIVDREEKIDLNDLSEEEVLFVLRAPKEELIQILVQRFDVDRHPVVEEKNMIALENAVDNFKNGDDYISVVVKDIIYNFPDVDLCNPEFVYTPPETGWNPQSSTSLTHEFFLPLDTVVSSAEFKGWKEGIVDDLYASKSLNLENNTEITKDQREGIERMNNTSQLVKIWETYGYQDIDSDGKAEKSIVTTLPDFGWVAKKILIDTFSGKYPFVKLYYELTDNRWFSHRGIPEIIEDLIKEIDVQHNMKIDNQTIRNAPMFIYRAGMINPSLVQMIPNQGIPVHGLSPLQDAIQVLNNNNPNVEFSYEREQMILETKIQEMLGQVDFSLNSLINRRQPRTLGEVQEQVSGAGRTASLDIEHYIQSFSELVEMVFDLWSKHGDSEYEFLYFGQNGVGERIKLTKEETQGKYKIVVRGNDQNTNPQTKIQKAQQIMLAVNNPVLLQMGIVTPREALNATKRFYQYMDVENWEELVNTNPQPPQPDPRTSIEPKFEELTDVEQAQVLESRNIKPDMQGRTIKRSREAVVEAAEVADKIGEEPSEPKEPKPAPIGGRRK